MAEDTSEDKDLELDSTTDTDDVDTSANEDTDTSTGTDEETEVNTDNDDEDTNDASDESSDLTKEQLDAMSDEEFTEFLNTGKLPFKETTKTKETVKSDKPAKSIKDADTDAGNKNNSESSANTYVKTETDSIDYKSIYESIFKPFKANGKEITPKTAEDVISLMQMGANYTKKMQLMAPMRKAAESLEKAKIKEDDLNFLIDVHNGDIEAIKKLLQKHKVDPFDLDLESTNYVPKNNIASDSDVEFSDVLNEVQSSLPRIQNILTEVWDAKSKQAVFKDPNLMRALHEEIENGRFDEVQNRLEQERMFGRYKGVPDINAYIDIVNKMVNETKNTPVVKKQESTPNPKTLNKTKAAPVRSKTRNQGTALTVKDLYSMSDEDFEKLSARDLI